jgi:ankyrin repeat protein
MTKSDAMYGAIGRGDIKTVRELIAQSPKLLTVYVVNKSWLHWAAQDDNIEIMQTLVEAGIPINQLTKDGVDTPLETAATQGHYDACQWLLDHGADINHGLGKVATPIFSAIYSRSLKLVELFVDRGADLSAKFGPPPKIDLIRFATENGSPEILQFLKERMKRRRS